MAVRSFRSPTTGLEFPTMNAKTSSSAFTGWNGIAALRAMGSASALSPPLPASMGLVLRWRIPHRASNSDFGFRAHKVVTASGILDDYSAQTLSSAGTDRTVFFSCKSHGHAHVGMELARQDHSPGLRCERKRAQRAAAAGAEFDLEPARDASAAGAFGPALFDACSGLA